MKTEICNCLSEILSGVSTEEFEMLMEIPPEEKLGETEKKNFWGLIRSRTLELIAIFS